MKLSSDPEIKWEPLRFLHHDAAVSLFDEE